MARWFSFLAETGEPATQSEAGSFGLTGLEAVANCAVGIAFLAIAAALIYLARREPSGYPGETHLLGLFILFIAVAGLSSLLSVAANSPVLQGLALWMKGATALVAAITAVVLWRFAPQLLQLPSRGRLQAEIAAHLRTLNELREARQQLEERVESRTRELSEAKQRFEIALRGSPITVFSQDEDMRFTWVHNPPAGVDPTAVIGRTDADLMPPETAGPVIEAKRRAMQTGQSQSIEANLDLFGRKRHFYVVIEALRDDAGNVIGTTSVAVDISERKEAENQLHLLLRELTHRSKNLLAVIQAIARQTASRTTSIDDFLQHFSARLLAIGSSHDLLIADNWHGASLRSLVEKQLGAFSDRFDGQISIEGENVMLKPEAVQQLGLALHELATNARKYGALSSGKGRLHIGWEVCDDGGLQFEWEEEGGPVVTAPNRSGFGRAVLENVIGRALEGEVTLAFPPKGVRCVIVLPETQIASRG